MPCYTEVTEEDIAARYRSEFRHNSDVAEMLCSVLRKEEREGVLIAEWYGDTVARWWKEHQERDRKKNEAERKAKKERDKRKAAVDKLTPEERRLLGIKTKW